MHASDIVKIRNQPEYKALVKRRGRLSWSLSIVVYVMLVGFIAATTWAPDFFSQTISATSIFSLGMLAGVILILSCIVFTWFYLHQCNTEFESLQNKLVEQFRND